MKAFNNKNFCLDNKTAESLYHEYAADMPIVDYHCHLDPQVVYENKNFENITQLWLAGDHYKWRAMRTNGVDERYCTGNASDWDKFEKWAETVPATLRNPLYHWTHMELKTAFGIDTLLNPSTAKEIYDECNRQLATDAFKPRAILKKYKVETFCTTDDPTDDLEYHRNLRAEGEALEMFPTWRADKAVNIEKGEEFTTYIQKLSKVSKISICSYTTLMEALQVRQDFFADNACILSDHGIEEFYAEPYTDEEIEAILKKALASTPISAEEIRKYKSCILHDLAVMDWNKGWTQQYHFGALRNNNSRLYKTLGPDSGFDSIMDANVAKNMSMFFDRLDSKDQLTQTVLYNLNPCHHEVVATMIGNFQDGSVAGKMQFGTGWWFLDQKDGMEKQIDALSSMGLLSRFIGMLTDSRSLLSFPRHEYFRRILCNMLGNDIEKGLIPNDMEMVGQMVKDICYHNIKNYLKLDKLVSA